MACRSCGGQTVPSEVSMRTIDAVPTVGENQILYLDYITNGVGSHRPVGSVTGFQYYFKSSPRNQIGKRVVHEIKESYPHDEVNYEDALRFVELVYQNYNLYAWRVETILEKVEVEIIEPVNTIESVEESTPIEDIMLNTQAELVEEETKISIDVFSIGKAKEELTNLNQKEYVQLLEDEKSGSNRKGMVDFLESMIDG